ncbi:hypothetical protein [Nocardioides sp. SYSU D00038]|nr:hypothetical protein [Nocardioides sp. SYSU D00038]
MNTQQHAPDPDREPAYADLVAEFGYDPVAAPSYEPASWTQGLPVAQ